MHGQCRHKGAVGEGRMQLSEVGQRQQYFSVTSDTDGLVSNTALPNTNEVSDSTSVLDRGCVQVRAHMEGDGVRWRADGHQFGKGLP